MFNYDVVKCVSVCIAINIILTGEFIVGECNQTEFTFDDEFYLKDPKEPHDFVNICPLEYFRERNLQTCSKLKHSVLEENKCMNNIDWNGRHYSINTNGKCIMLYDGYECSGNFTSLFPTNPCGLSLRKCGWLNRMVSASLCEAISPKINTPYGTRGNKCKTECTTHKKNFKHSQSYTHYFRCDTEDSWDFCYWRMGQNFFGEFCDGNCSLPDLWLSNNIVVYDGERFQGKGMEISLNDSFACANIDYQHHKNSLFSISFQQPCIRLYTGVECNGNWKEFHSNILFSVLPRYAKSIRLCNSTDFEAPQKVVDYHNDYSHIPTATGKSCKTNCEANGRFYYWCEVGDLGKWDFCFPEQGQYLFDRICKDNCSFHDFWPSDPSMRHQKHDKFEKIPNSKFPHHYDTCRTIPLRNPSDIQFSISSTGKCVRLYESIGCTGNGTDVSINVIFYIVPNKVRSFSICNPTFPAYSGIAVNGEICSGMCKAGPLSYFSCKLPNGTQAFCSPRNFTDYVGNSYDVQPWLPSLYEKSEFSGKQFFFTAGRNSSCFNVYDEYISWNSIDAKDLCLRLYKNPGCVHNFEVINKTMNFECGRDFIKCRWSNPMSISYCSSPLRVPYEHPVGSSGKRCIRTCSAREDTHLDSVNTFFCRVQTGTDICSPAEGVDYFGNDCDFNCSVKPQPHVVNLYDGPNFTGTEITVIRNDAQLCYNVLGNISMPDFTISSIKLNSNCIRLYKSFGCNDHSYFVTFPKFDSQCLQNFFSCSSLNHKWLSMNFCYDDSPKIRDYPSGVSGKLCKDDCSPKGTNFFTCTTDAHVTEFCYPFVGRDHTGQHMCPNCGCNQNEIFAKISDGIYGITKNTVFVNVLFREIKDCYNYESRLLKKPNLVDLLEDKCIKVHENIGCLGFTLKQYDRFDSSDWYKCRNCKTKFPRSFSRCNKSFPAIYTDPLGLTGSKCITNCTSGSGYTFTCRTNAFRKEFCIPREDLNHFGQICDQENCEFKTRSKKPKTNWKRIALCSNIKQTNAQMRLENTLHGLSLAKNICLHIYNGHACTGNLTKIVFTSLNNSNLEALNYDIKSFKMCDTYLQPQYHVGIAYSGVACDTPCVPAPGSNDEFACIIKNGSNVGCFLRPREELLEKIDFHSNISLTFKTKHVALEEFVDFASIDDKDIRDYIRLCKESYWKNPQNCMNVSHSEINTMVCFNVPNQNSKHWTSSIELNSYCITAHDDFGCTGNSTILLPNSTCPLSLDTCGWDNRIASISPCKLVLPPILRQVNGSKGQSCQTDCTAPGNPYFSCRISANGSWDFCFPRLRQNFFGKFCVANCTNPDLWLSNNVVIYESVQYEGRGTETILDKSSECHNIVCTTKANCLFSISTKQHCVSFYGSIGCTGKRELRSPEQFLNLDSKYVRSMSLCNATFPEERGVSLSGEICGTDCEAGSKEYFSCSLASGSKQFCSPRTLTNYLGNSCNGSECLNVDNARHPWMPVFYTLPDFSGESFFLGSKDSRRCYNLIHDFPHLKWNSVDIKNFCVVFYNGIGCLGGNTTVTTMSRLKCLTNFSNCDWESPFSVSYCDAPVVNLFKRPISIGGRECLTSCTTSLSNTTFSCNIGQNEFDFCSPADGINFLGENCTQNCGLINGDEAKVEFFETPNFGRRTITIVPSVLKICHNLPETFPNNDFFLFASMKIHRTCVKLYKSIGCINYDRTLMPIVDDNCARNLTSCNIPSNWLSVQFCSDGLPPISYNPCGISGRPCEDSCLPTGQGWFSCKTGIGPTEKCFPRNGVNYTGQELCSDCRCKTNDVLATMEYTLEETRWNKPSKYKIKIALSEVQPCYNFGFDSLNKESMIHQDLAVDILKDEYCLTLYEYSGCAGKSKSKSGSFDIKCQGPSSPHFQTILLETQCAVSLSLCNSTFPELYKNPVSLTGRTCFGDCRPRFQQEFFICDTPFSLNEFCIPRKDLNHFGQICEHDNCVFKKLPAFVVPSQRNQEDTLIELHNASPCYNIHRSNRGEENSQQNFIHYLHKNITCLFLHADRSCVGKAIQGNAKFALKCLKNPSSCGLNIVSSFRFCDAFLPQMVQLPVGNSGQICKSACELRNKHYFSCELHDGSCDFCSPRPGQNYLGEICKHNCTIKAEASPQCNF